MLDLFLVFMVGHSTKFSFFTFFKKGECDPPESHESHDFATDEVERNGMLVWLRKVSVVFQEALNHYLLQDDE